MLLLTSNFSRSTCVKSIIVRLKSTMAKMSEALTNLPEVEIDPKGVFKYILIKVYDEISDSGEPSKLIVRGFADCPYHADIYERFQEKASKLKLDTEVLGGGRINHDAEHKKIKVYGYSQGYGKADHTVAASILKKKYSDYEFECSDEGY